MFTELHPLARQGQILILLSAEGALLRVNITPKAKDGENPALATPLSLLATPEELDAQLPEILRGYTAAHMDLRAALGSAVAQIEAGKATTDKPAAEGKAAAKKPDTKKPMRTLKADPKTEPAEPPAAGEEQQAPVDDDEKIVATDQEIAQTEADADLPEAQADHDHIASTGNMIEEPAPTPAEATPPAEENPEPLQQPDPDAATPTAPDRDPNTIELF